MISRRKAIKPLDLKRMHAIKEGPCIACYVLGLPSCTFTPAWHHIVVGNRRKGDRWTFGLGDWHHQGYPPTGMTEARAIEVYGPSLAGGSKPFFAHLGKNEDELLEIQDGLLPAYGYTEKRPA